MTSDQTATEQSEAARGEAFMERIFAASLATFDVLNIHLGSRLGLYEALAGGGARTPGELAAAVRYLCGPDAGYITGQTLHVNGGRYLP